VFVPGLTLHPSGALFTSHFSRALPEAQSERRVDILDAHSGALRLRIVLPQQLMTDVDGLHGSFWRPTRMASVFLPSLHPTAARNTLR